MAKPGPKPNPAIVRSAVVHVRCRPEWKAWLEECAARIGTDTSDFLDQAALAFAREKGWSMPPRR